jgi:KDO2-lipid IV(A) lauroyltransferase
MRAQRRPFGELWREARSDAGSARGALVWLLQYLAFRIFGTIVGCFPVNANLVTARLLGDFWWVYSRKHRDRAMDNLRHALGDRHSEAELQRIGRRSVEHFAQVYLVELNMTPRLVNEWSWSRYVELRELGLALRELLLGRGVIMVTPHFGNFELLGYTIARLGLPIAAVMRPLDNPFLNDYLLRSRQAGRLELLIKKGAAATADDILAAGGTLCFIADQDAGKKAVFVDFFGRKASTYKSIGLLALRHRVPVVVGYAARTRRGFHYAMNVERIIRPEEWEPQADPLLWVTQEFSSAMERSIRRHPEQYLWMHRRWKTRPKEESGTQLGRSLVRP